MERRRTRIHRSITSGPSGNIVLTSSYADWAAVNAPGQNVYMDYDGDGVQNGIEFFMGLSGSGFTANPAPDANRRVTWSMASNYSGVYGINYAVQTSPNLNSWSDVPQNAATIVAGSSVSHAITGTGAKFVRLVVRPD